uniref:Cobalt/zinc/cadmium efflux RND transporter, membrane fusion protein, CzcB family n=1 Tax=Klebsiella pneumoniae TaxID=573 RepID=A0A8B0SYL3_KLEPN|nr:Cobalt/zinc/cadmium efflux RND transporter, membrane fusion protein, CzcB family [Klebsiella pneumoniae]
MDMDSVPKYADESGDESSGGIRIDPTQVQNLGLKKRKKSHARNAELFPDNPG